MAFSQSQLNKEIFKGKECVAEGHTATLNLITQLFSALGTNIITVNTSQKPAYHAAAVIASNYLVTLAAKSTELLQQIGISQPLSRKIIDQLMHSSFANIQQAKTISDALTGPLARGDLSTVKLHLEALANSDSLSLYKAVGLASLSLTSLEEHQASLLRELLNNQEFLIN